MNEPQAQPDNSQTDNYANGDSPRAFPTSQKKPPEDGDEGEAPHEDEIATYKFDIKPWIGSRIWNWVRQDTTSTDWLIVLLTAVIAGTSYLQWREIHASSNDTHTLAQAADTQAKKMGTMSDAADKIKEAAQGMVIQDQRIADNAEKAMEASNAQSKAVLDEAIDSSHLEQRAWVANMRIEMDAPTVGKKIEARVIWQNTGKTFAMHVKPVCHLGFVEMPFASENELMQDASEPARQSIGVMPPNGESRTPVITENSASDTDKSRIEGSWYTYVWGEITYDDIFKHPHITKFCSFRQGTAGDFIQCPFHNDAN